MATFFNGHIGFAILVQDRSEAQMYIFGVRIPRHMREKETAVHSEILRRVNNGGIRRIIESIKLIRAHLNSRLWKL